MSKSKATKRKRGRLLAAPHGSAFLEWFYEQAGKPIMNEAQYLKLRHETIPSLRRQLAEAETNLAEMDRYHTAHQYALYAWMSGPNEKGELPRLGNEGGAHGKDTNEK